MKFFGGIVAILSFLAFGQVRAGQITYLKIVTADGQSLQAPVKSFKGLSFGVVATLVKQGKMKFPPTNPDPQGHMTFYLDKSVTTDFVVWAAGKNATAKSGQFAWVDPSGSHGENFTMTGVKVTQFTGTGANSDNAGTLVLIADETVADPPINFKPKK